MSKSRITYRFDHHGQAISAHQYHQDSQESATEMDLNSEEAEAGAGNESKHRSMNGTDAAAGNESKQRSTNGTDPAKGNDSKHWSANETESVASHDAHHAFTHKSNSNSASDEANKNANKNKFRKQEPKDVIPLHPSEFEVVEESPVLNQFTSDFGDWNSPFDTEVGRLEQMIKQSSNADFQQMHGGSSQRARNNEPYDKTHGGPIHAPIIEDIPKGTRYMRRHRPPWARMIASVSGAVVTGVLFGWFVLSLFSHEPGDEGAQLTDRMIGSGVQQEQQGTAHHDPLDPPPGEQPIPVDRTDDETDEFSPVMEQDGILRVDLPARSFIVIQHGVFSSVDGVREAQNMLQSKGYSGVSELKDHYYVYTALTMNRDDAIVLKHQMDQAELESFIKEYDLPSIATVEWKGKATSAVRDYFVKGNDLVEMISRLTVIQLGKEHSLQFEASSLQSVRELHQEWTNLFNEMKEGLDQTQDEMLQRMNNALDLAVISLEEFNKNPSNAHLWQAQAGITQFVLLQHGLLADMDASNF